MNESPTRVDAAPVTDHRPAPRGVLPRGMQTWLMVGVAVGMVAIILIAGRPEPPAKTVSTMAPTSAPPNADRVRDYQDRLRVLEARTAQESQAQTLAEPTNPVLDSEPRAVRSEDPLVAERKRREYESLFASNVILSRRPQGQRPDAGQSATASPIPARPLNDQTLPSIDEIADAAVRATSRVQGPVAEKSAYAAPSAPKGGTATGQTPPTRPTHTDPINDAGSLHRILEGTIIDTVLTNRLDGSVAAPLNCLVTNPVYSHSGQQIVIPAGARVLGETKPVQTLGETRLAVAFHRLLMPDGSTYSLDQFLGANQIGDAGLRDQVNQHYWSTFGAAAAVGLISGLAQFVGTAGLGVGDRNRTVVIAGGAADAASQASVQTMNRFLNRLPTITIREGHRVKVYLTSDLELPAYAATAASTSRF